MRRRFPPHALCLVLPLLGLLSSSVTAQPRCVWPKCSLGDAPTTGVHVPVGALTGDADATAVALNPANLAFLPSWNGYYLHTEFERGGTRVGRGDAFFAATPLPYLSMLSVGAGIQVVRPPDQPRTLPDGATDRFTFRDVGRLDFALAWRIWRWLAIGGTYAHIFPGNTPNTGGIDTFDLSASARLGRHVAAALVVHDVPQPNFHGLAIQRVWEPELLFRPLGDDRFEIGLAARFGERRQDISPRVRLRVMPYPGLVFAGALELKQEELLGRDRVLTNDLRATLGFELDLEHVGVGGYAHFGTSTGSGPFHGWSATLRLSGDRYPTLITPRKLERIDLAGMDERQHASLIAHLRKLERRKRTDGVVLVLGAISGGWARMEELRAALLRLRAAGRHVFAYGAELNTKSYLVGTAAEKLWLDPAGGLRLVGMSSTANYFKGTFDKVGIKADFIKIAEYKSAPEQCTRTGPSDEARQQRSALVDDIYGRLVATLGAARKLDPARMRALIDEGPFTAAEALKHGLVDGLKHGDEVEEAIGEVLHHPVTAAYPPHSPLRPQSFAAPTIGVIFVEGDIVEGKSATIPLLDMKLVGHRTILQAIHEARSDSRVKAIVLRVDSPGGSALASDLIAREIKRTREVKPVICSFGDVAASGGYFIAAGCETIFASPSTVTGSIGIFTGKFDVSGLANLLGVGWETTKRGEHADMESMWRSYTDEERVLILSKLRYFYDRFVNTVAEGRKLKPADVDAVGRGHVWTGAMAKDRKLVDRMGGLEDAIREAKKRAGFDEEDPVDLRWFPPDSPTLLGQLLDLLGIKLEEKSIEQVVWKRLAGAVLGAVPGSVLVDPSTPQARMDHTLTLE